MNTLLTIDEVARRTGLTAHTLRYYERIGLIAPVPRAAGGQRRCAAAVLDTKITFYRAAELAAKPLETSA